ncbi:MAG: TetR/AcrR family transcriptional regulator [Methanomethylophilus sp.]|jgi:AcrR family transcriptional regulator
MTDLTAAAFVTAFRKVLREKPYDQVKVTEVVERSFFSRQTFYKHFGGAFDMVIWVYAREPGTPVPNWKARTAEAFRTTWEYRDMISAAYRSSVRPKLRHYYRVLGREIGAGAAKELRDRDDAVMMGHVCGSVFEASICDWIASGMKASVKEVTWYVLLSMGASLRFTPPAPRNILNGRS